MYLKDIQLINFKNHSNSNYTFSPHINGITGLNGVGKTNLLDAIHYLSMTKSYFNSLDQLNINFEADFFAIHGVFENSYDEGTQKVSCVLKRDQKKILKLNQKEYTRMANHIGLFPSVMISPYDSDYINGGSELRRKYFDSVISQYDRIYLDTLIQYNKVLMHRNALLKQFTLQSFYDADSMDIWNEKLIALGEEIYLKRKLFISEFIPVFNLFFKQLSTQQEDVSIVYDSQLHNDSFSQLIKDAKTKDTHTQYSTVGIHKDDFLFLMNNVQMKRISSQGQQKTFLISLKLAHYNYLEQIKKIKPMLLLDDVFDKLDEMRVKKLTTLVADRNFGQVFITHTQKKSIEDLLQPIGLPFELFEIL